VQKEKVAFGINHEMTDFVSRKRKKLDLVICLPRTEGKVKKRVAFADLAKTYDAQLSDIEMQALAALPPLHSGLVGDVLLALESKACMTAHTRAQPRFYDELTSSAQCINGSSPGAIAAGYAVVNVSDDFISPDLNRHSLRRRRPIVSHDPQPISWQRALATTRSLVIRGHAVDRGYDAVGVTMLDMVNDGSPVAMAASPPSLDGSDPLNYERMVMRVSGLYDTRFISR
jgi:hypothetical protein